MKSANGARCLRRKFLHSEWRDRIKLHAAVAAQEAAARVAVRRPWAPAEAAAGAVGLEEQVESGALAASVVGSGATRDRAAWVWVLPEVSGPRVILAVLRGASSRVLQAALRPIAQRGPGFRPLAASPSPKSCRFPHGPPFP